ncbi:MAG: methylated-DNA--[protein]-cysteine S-methyltransferase [Lactobacillus sp.]
MKDISKLTIKTPIGLLEITAEGDAIVGVKLVKHENEVKGNDSSMKMAQKAKDELEEYFAGKRKEFDLPLRAEGTDFQKKVWEQLRKIPYGETRTYGEVAQMMGNPKASRAIGMANHNNPILILTPCHRVIGSDGSLTGYAAGIEAKKYLLDFESSNKANF